MAFIWERISGINSDDLGRAITSYSALHDIYRAVKELQYFSTLPHLHTSESLFRRGLENPLDMALAEICHFSRFVNSSASFARGCKAVYDELAQAINRSEITLSMTDIRH